MIAATSTMYASEFPLSQFAYPDFWRGRVAFNPLLDRIGVRGAVPAVAIAAIGAFALGSLLRTVLMSRRRSPDGVRS